MIRNKGIDQVTVDDLIEEITPKARGKLVHIPYHGMESPSILTCICPASVPEPIKTELLERIKTFIEKEAK